MYVWGSEKKRFCNSGIYVDISDPYGIISNQWNGKCMVNDQISQWPPSFSWVVIFMCLILTLSNLNLPLSSSSTTSRELLSQFTTCSEWRWFEVGENYHVLVNQFHENFHSKTPSCRKIRSVFKDVRRCFNASWGLKGLKQGVVSWVRIAVVVANWMTVNSGLQKTIPCSTWLKLTLMNV